MKIVVGLGNPGRRYRNTRHNAGFIVVDRLARRHGIKINRKKYHSRVGEVVIKDSAVVLAKPTCFMNYSGLAVEALVNGYGSEVNELIVVHDDIDIAQGKIRVKHGGGDAGHRGISSVMEHLGTGAFTRVRVGVGRPARGEDVVDYVLESFSADELSLVEPAFNKAVDAVEALLVAEGPELTIS